MLKTEKAIRRRVSTLIKARRTALLPETKIRIGECIRTLLWVLNDE